MATSIILFAIALALVGGVAAMSRKEEPKRVPIRIRTDERRPRR